MAGIGITLPSEDGGALAIQWMVTSDVAEKFIAELRDRLGEAHLESLIGDPDLITENTRRIVTDPSYVCIAPDRHPS
jgi:hypothetical protein